ncbi:hypothetical protein [Streptomyces sp. NPDC001948]
MADTGDVLDVLADQLEAEHGREIAAAAWAIVGLGERLADAAVWQNGVDSVRAMAAAQSCREARRYLLAPTCGRSVQTPRPTSDATSSCARLLDRLASVLQSSSGAVIQPDVLARKAAAEHTTAAHQALSAIWRTP